MTLADLIPLVTGAGGALVILVVAAWMFVTGKIIPKPVHDKITDDKDKQIADLIQAVARERQRADAAVIAAEATRDLVQALHSEAKR